MIMDNLFHYHEMATCYSRLNLLRLYTQSAEWDVWVVVHCFWLGAAEVLMDWSESKSSETFFIPSLSLAVDLRLFQPAIFCVGRNE